MVYALPDQSYAQTIGHRFAFEGIGHLMQHLLISNARFIHAANEFGINKMMRNMLALRQNIKTIADDSQDLFEVHEIFPYTGYIVYWPLPFLCNDVRTSSSLSTWMPLQRLSAIPLRRSQPASATTTTRPVSKAHFIVPEHVAIQDDAKPK